MGHECRGQRARFGASYGKSDSIRINYNSGLWRHGVCNRLDAPARSTRESRIVCAGFVIILRWARSQQIAVIIDGKPDLAMRAVEI
jgi:hypothetical protein